jgi:hypothetical protein
MVSLEDIPREPRTVDNQERCIAAVRGGIELSGSAVAERDAWSESPDMFGAGRQLGDNVPV